MSYFVYILYSQSLDIYYKGQTEDINARIKRHNLKHEKATQNGVPWKLVWCIEKPNRSDAVILERKLKNLSRKRILAFINKYRNEVAGPDDPDHIVRMSGC